MLAVCCLQDRINRMNTETMLGLLRRQPFQPLEVRMSNGDAYQIRYPEMAFLLKSSLILGSPESDDFVFCSLLHVADVKASPISSSDKTNGQAL
jgi:hypothetical protein